MKKITHMSTPVGNNEKTMNFHKEFTLECVMIAQRAYEEMEGVPPDGNYPNGTILQLAGIVASSRIATQVKFSNPNGKAEAKN